MKTLLALFVSINFMGCSARERVAGVPTPEWVAALQQRISGCKAQKPFSFSSLAAFLRLPSLGSNVSVRGHTSVARLGGGYAIVNQHSEASLARPLADGPPRDINNIFSVALYRDNEMMARWDMLPKAK